MKKYSLALLISLTLLIAVPSSLNMSEIAISQTPQITPNMTQANTTDSINKTQSFSTQGTINTLSYIIINNTLLDPSDKGISISNITHGLNLAAKSIGDGNWTLEVNNGKTEQFVANLSFINADGTQYHTHSIGNFTSNEFPPVVLTPENTTIIKGKSDVALNGITVWKQVDTTIIISKNKSITIVLDDQDTDNHFVQQPIYGKVKSFIG